MYKPSQNSTKKISAQAMVEFALALPILLLVVYGLLETGRLIFIYASVVTAARQAARYGAASGDIGSGKLYYQDCPGIQAAANKVAFIQRFSSIDIKYDTGPNTSDIGSGCPLPTINDNDHRIKVTVSANFTPIVPLVPFGPFTITSSSNRTILTGVSIAVDPGSVNLPPGGGGAIRLTKQASPNSYNAAGTVITYSFKIENLSSDPVVNIVLTDPMFPNNNFNDIHCPDGLPFQLGTSGTEICTASYTTTQADVDTGRNIVNTATATGIDSTNAAVTATSQATVNFVASPKLALTKTGVAPALISVGQPVAYTFTLENTGNVTLTDPFTIVDSLIGTNWSCPSGPLAVGASMDCTGRHPLVSADINNGYVNNTAHATARYGNTTVTSNTSSAHVITPELFIVLTANKTSVSAPGDQIVFTYTLTNRTSATVTSITVTDSLPSTGNTVCSVASLDAGAQTTCTRTYTISQAEIDASSVLINTATATSKKIGANDSGVTITINQNPVLTLTKAASPTQPPSGTTFTLPATITYTYTLKNSGNITLSAPFGVTDDKLGVPNCAGFSSGTLAPLGTLTCSATYSLKQADLDNGSVINKATATGVFSSQTVTSAQASATVVTYTLPRLTVLKTADVQFFSAAKQGINYIYTLKNTGGVPLTFPASYTLSDNKLANIVCGAIGTLPVGGSTICKTFNYTTTDLDVLAKHITNTVTAPTTGISPVPTIIQAAPLDIPLFICDATTVKGSGPIGDGSSVTWTITNSSGLPIHIASATISWGGGGNPKLSQVLLNAISIFNGSGSSIYILPGAPWTLNNSANPMNLLFGGKTATGIRVVVTFSESACSSFFLDSNVP